MAFKGVFIVSLLSWLNGCNSEAEGDHPDTRGSMFQKIDLILGIQGFRCSHCQKGESANRDLSFRLACCLGLAA